MRCQLLVFLYAEHGGKHFFNTYRDSAYQWLEYFSIPVPVNSKILVYSFNEFKNIDFDENSIHAIFYCPGSLLGSGKDMYNLLGQYSDYLIGCCDHFTNPWQRFSNEITGHRFSFISSFLILRSEICKERVLQEGFQGKILVINEDKINQSISSISNHCGITSQRSVVFITEWYENDEDCAIKFDQECSSFQDQVLFEYSLLINQYPTVIFSARKHPHLIDVGWQFPKCLTSNKNFLDVSMMPLDALFIPSNIFIGIDSQVLLRSASQSCLTYSIHSNNSTFCLSNYESSIVNLPSLQSLANE